jgi:two-component system chemotaxis response regulator CheB
MPRDVVVIGCSAGGLEALLQIVEKLPAALPASIFVVQHTSPESPGYLSGILDQRGPLRATYAVDGDIFAAGNIYVARPDRHLLLDPDRTIRVVMGAKENRSRPAIDPLFRSAALNYGPRVIGVILSGGLDDGVAGLRGIKMCGGTAVVQEPLDAVADSMPRQALRFVSVDHVAAARDIGKLLADLVNTEGRSRSEGDPIMIESLKAELKASKGALLANELTALGDHTLFTCPECHGTLVRLRDRGPMRFRCHTGHAFTAQSLVAELQGATEEALWNTIRSLEESAMVFSHLADHAENEGDARDLTGRANQAHQDAREVRRLASTQTGAAEDLSALQVMQMSD